MNAPSSCAQCGGALPAGSLEGLCPRCLLGMGLTMALDSVDPSWDSPAATEPVPVPENRIVRRFGDYELLEEIARGGMGIVYRARQISLNRIVAVKVMLFGQFSSDEFVRRFKAEAAAAAALQHPNIVAIHEIGEQDGHHYFSMDYVEGPNLAEVVRERPLTSREAAIHLRSLARAVHYAHQRGVLHRDLKPSNVLLDGTGQARLTDFGLAKRLEGPSLSSTGQMVGSPNYVPPEQTAPDRGPVGPASDVYSLGAILYHLVTGRAPIVADSLEGTLLSVLNDEPVSPRLLNANVARDIETICLKCLEKNSHRRYASAEALAEDLDLYLQGQPIRARPVGAVEKVVRWCRRKPAAAAALVLLAGLAAGSTLVANHLSRLHNVARWNAYVSEMGQAQFKWQERNYAEAFYYLQRQIPRPGETDLRGFEWRHLWSLSRGNCAFRLPVHPQIVGWLGFSPDGDSLATFRWDTTNTLRVWDLAGGNIRWAIPDATSVGGYSADGKLFVAGKGDHSIAVCDARNGKPLKAISGAGEIVAFAPQAVRVVTAEGNHVLKVRELRTFQTVLSLTNAARRYFDAGKGAPVALSSDGLWLAMIRPGDPSEASDRGVEVWNVTTGEQTKFRSHHRQIRTLQFSPDGKGLAVADGGGGVLIWSWSTHEARSIAAHVLPIQSLGFSPDGQTLVTGGTDESIKVWDLSTLKEKPTRIEGQIGAPWSLAISPDQRLLVSGSRDMTVNAWELNRAAAPAITNLNSENVGNFTFSPDAKLMAGGCRDDMVRIWDTATRQEKYRIQGVNYAVAFARDNSHLLVADDSGMAKWWDFKSGTHRSVPTYGGLGQITCAEFSPNRRMAAVGHKSGKIQLLEIDTGKILGTFAGHDEAVMSLSFAPDGLSFASGGRDKTIRFWDIEITNRSRQVCAEHKGAVAGVAISPDGRTMVSGCSASTIKFWDMQHLEKSLGARTWHRSPIHTLTFSPDNRRMVSGSEDQSVRLWDFVTQSQMAGFRFDGPIQLVAFSSDANNLAVVTREGSLHLLQAATLAEADAEIRALFSKK